MEYCVNVDSTCLSLSSSSKITKNSIEVLLLLLLLCGVPGIRCSLYCSRQQRRIYHKICSLTNQSLKPLLRMHLSSRAFPSQTLNAADIVTCNNEHPDTGRVTSRAFFGSWLVNRKHVLIPKTGVIHEVMEQKEKVPDVQLKNDLDCIAFVEESPVKTSDSAKTLPPPQKVRKNNTNALQTYLESMMRSRGYSAQCYEALSSAYHNKPTPLQQASFGEHVVQVVRNRDMNRMKALLSAGLSSNPCNSYGESLIHMICRRGDSEMIQLFLDHGCCVQVADNYGRTPLHEACWAPKPVFEVVDLLLQQDPFLLQMRDFRGLVPLLYTRQEHWALWIEYFESRKEVYWPRRENTEPNPPALALQRPNTRPTSESSGGLTVQLANMISSGRMDLDEIKLLRYSIKPSVLGDVDISTGDDVDCSENGTESYNEDTINEDEMADILRGLDVLEIGGTSLGR